MSTQILELEIDKIDQQIDHLILLQKTLKHALKALQEPKDTVEEEWTKKMEKNPYSLLEKTLSLDTDNEDYQL